VSSGIQSTFDLLAKTDNCAAVAVLIEGIDASVPEVREASFAALLRQSNVAAQRAIVERWPTLSAAQRGWVETSGISLYAALQEIFTSENSELFDQAVEIAIQCRSYENLPLLIQLAQQRQHARHDSAVGAVHKLVVALQAELKAAPDKRRHGIENRRRDVIAALQDAISQFDEHQNLQLLEAFLILVTRENQLLREAWSSTKHPAHSAILRLLRLTSRPEILDLLAGSVLEAHPSQPVIKIVGLRHDLLFLKTLLSKIDDPFSEDLRRNLSRVDHLTWCDEHSDVLDQLDGKLQATAIFVAAASSLKNEKLYQLLCHLAESPHPEGRKAAIEKLSSFVDTKTNEIILDAVEDDHAAVRAEALSQLRPRGITGAIKLLLKHIDSPHITIQDVVRDALSEFNLTRYLAVFDKMSEDARKNTGRLVRQVDVNTVGLLSKELQNEATARQLRALQVIEVMQLETEIESELLIALRHDDHFVRAEAARLLGNCPTANSQNALRDAMLDRNVRVRENAEAALQAIAKTKPLPHQQDTAPISQTNVAS